MYNHIIFQVDRRLYRIYKACASTESILPWDKWPALALDRDVVSKYPLSYSIGKGCKQKKMTSVF